MTKRYIHFKKIILKKKKGSDIQLLYKSQEKEIVRLKSRETHEDNDHSEQQQGEDGFCHTVHISLY